MKKIFIAYADEKMAYSLHRIGRQAKKLNFFDEIRLYTPQLLPESVKNWKLMQYSYGGGYWAWKPFIIWDTLQKEEEGSQVFYVDAGCTLQKGYEWEWLSELAKNHETILFQYKEFMPEWKKFGSDSTKIKHWTKKESLDFLDLFVNNPNWKEQRKIWGGFIIMTEKHNRLLSDWLTIVREYPEIILDPKPDDPQETYFAQHKHDQSVLVALSQKYQQSCLVLPEFQESMGEKVPICASRIRAKTRMDYIWHVMKNNARKIIGIKLYNNVKALIK